MAAPLAESLEMEKLFLVLKALVQSWADLLKVFHSYLDMCFSSRSMDCFLIVLCVFVLPVGIE